MTASVQKANKIKGKEIARFVLLPEILPRARELGGSGFGYLAFLIASVYRAVRILPAAHPFTLAGNIGTFGIRQVVAAAADNVIVDRKHIDQIIIFFAVIVAILLLGFQFLAVIFLLFSGEAFAQAAGGTDFQGMFTTTQPAKDIAFMLLDHVFGVPDFFKSEVLTAGANAGPTPFHRALHAMFQFYNLALLIVAVLIFLYFVMVVVAETAIHGTPFGKRFNTVYAPLRLVFAIGLLVPLNHGLNASQYIVLGAARAGSGMATNGWILFNRNISNPTGTEHAKLVAEPKPPVNVGMDQFMTVAHSCRMAYNLTDNKILIKNYVVSEGQALDYNSLDYRIALQKSTGGNIEVIIGEKGETTEHKKYPGNIIPYCGTVTIPMNVRNPASINSSGAPSSGGSSIGPEHIQESYYKLMSFIFVRPSVEALGERMAKATFHGKKKEDECWKKETIGDGWNCKTSFKPPASYQQEITQATASILAADVKNGVNSARSAANFKISEEVLKRGWGGAGIWYNQIAELNGAIVDASQSFPTVSKWPLLMERIQSDKAAQDGKSDPCNRFTANMANGEASALQPNDTYILQAMVSSYRYWYCDMPLEEKGLSGNIFWDAIHVIFGTNGLFGLRHNNDFEVHPLAQLATIGKGLVESSIRNMAYSMTTAVAGGFMGAISPHWGASLQAMSGFFVSVAMIGLTAGFILFYILPFLPFIYFFFAVGAWVKTIFEAMVGAPLWALAHLRIDGDGFSGRSAANGYFLIFEIFIRPILTVFGLLGGMAIFTAMAVILNDLFNFVVFQVTGTALTAQGTSGEYMEFRRSVVDEFFYTIVYCILLYMMGLASFKMIDLVPNNILRWMGAGVSTFADQAGDPKEGLVQWAAIGGHQIGGQLVGAMNKGGAAVGSLAGALANMGRGQQQQPPG